jgi:hypothetical protein
MCSFLSFINFKMFTTIFSLNIFQPHSFLTSGNSVTEFCYYCITRLILSVHRFFCLYFWDNCIDLSSSLIILFSVMYNTLLNPSKELCVFLIMLLSSIIYILVFIIIIITIWNVVSLHCPSCLQAAGLKWFLLPQPTEYLRLYAMSLH